jgi:hypothetical protein
LKTNSKYTVQGCMQPRLYQIRPPPYRRISMNRSVILYAFRQSDVTGRMLMRLRPAGTSCTKRHALSAISCNLFLGDAATGVPIS